MNEVLSQSSETSIKRPDYWSVILSIYMSMVIIIIFIFLSDDFLHWFIIPLLLCGIIISIDVFDWIRNKIDIFDPVGFIGLLGFHFFFLAPLLQIYWDYGMTYVIPPDDWRPWLGLMATLNFLGLIVYKYSRKFFLKRTMNRSLRPKHWKIDKRKLFFISIPLLIIMMILQGYVYMTQGGILGYITSFAERSASFEGMGWLFMISESFPIIFIILAAVFLRNSKHKKSILLIISLLLVYFIINMLFGGLRGSRSNTIWAMVWGVGILHFWVRPISRKFIYIGLVFLILFVNGYSLYKGAGEDLELLLSSDGRAEIAEETDRGLDRVLLSDFARSNVQAFILYRLSEHPDNYNLAYGRSYIGDVSILIPKSIWPDRPPTKVKEGTEIVLGKDSYNPSGYTATRVYGLTGEFMLNFGYLLLPLIFIVLGFFVAKVKSILYQLDRQDSRMLIYPFLIVCCFLLLVQDLDNFIFAVIKNLAIPFIVIWLSSNKISRLVK